MNARTAGTVVVLALAAAIVAGVLVLRRPALAPPSRLPGPQAASSTEPAIAPTVETVAPPPAKTAPPSRARSAFDRVLAALRSGDRAKAREALEELRKELVPPAVPDAENAAVLYRRAFELYPEGMNDEETELVGRLSDGQALTAEERAKLQAVLGRSRDALAVLHEAADRPRCNFSLEYAQGSALLTDHLTGLIRSARLLDLEALLVEGAPVSEATRSSFRLAEAVADEPALISQLIRGICLEITFYTHQREFEGELSADRLRSLVAALDPARVRSGSEKTLFFALYSVTQRVLDGGDPKPLREAPPVALAGPDLEHFTETLSACADLVGRPYYEVRDELRRLEIERVQGAPAWAELTRMTVPSLVKASERQAHAEATLGTAQVAAALRLYRDSQGAYPATLDELRAILPGAPVDPFTGKPYLYRREGSGFVVYSVGEDGQDSGGVSSEHDVLFKSPR